jgi:flagellar protein FlaJ
MSTAGYKRLSVRLFGWLAKGSEKSFSSLSPWLKGAGMHMLLKTYISVIYMTTAIALVTSLAVILAISLMFVEDLVMIVYFVMFGPVLTASFTFLIMYMYPSQRYKSARKSIDNNLPFALIHMDSISSSGIPIEFMFDLIGRLKEYGEVSRQARLVVRNIKTFGMSSVSAINSVAEITPSPAFKQVLTGISSTISKGGNLSGFLKEMSNKSLFDYRIEREKHVKTLATYADIYTSVMIAAPLMMLAVLVMMNVIGGDVFGLTIPDAIGLMTYVMVPLMNIGFLAFLQMKSPSG